MPVTSGNGVTMDYGQMDSNISLFTDAIAACHAARGRVEDEITSLRASFTGGAGDQYQVAVNTWTENYDLIIADLTFMAENVSAGKNLTMRTDAMNSEIAAGLTANAPY